VVVDDVVVVDDDIVVVDDDVEGVLSVDIDEVSGSLLEVTGVVAVAVASGVGGTEDDDDDVDVDTVATRVVEAAVIASPSLEIVI